MKRIILFMMVFLLGISWQGRAQILTEDFESGFTNFSNAPGNNVDFAIATNLYHGGTQSTHNAYASTNTNILHETGVLDLSGTTNPTLVFWHIAKTEGGWDKCYVEISTDGGTAYTALAASEYVGSASNYEGYFHEDSYTTWGTSDVTPANTWWQKETFKLSAYIVANVKIRFRLKSDGSVNRNGWYLDDIEVADLSCPAPTALAATNITSTGADLGWTTGGANAWEIVVQAAGIGEPTGAGTATSANPYVASGLTANTNYEFYVRDNCGAEFSAWAGPYAFTTACAIYTPDYAEDFATFIPTCWEEADNGDATSGPTGLGTGAWTIGTKLSTGSAKINLYTDSRSDWILSPQFDLSAGGYEVVIDVAVTDYNGSTSDVMGSDDKVQLLYTEDGTTWNLLTAWTVTDNLANSPTTFTFALTSTGASVQFGILATDGPTDDTEDYDFHVDKFMVRTPPACPEPTGLTATNITTTGADLGWTTGGASAWEIVVQAAGVGAPVGAGTATSTNPYVASGLTSTTAYEFYVRDNCGGDLSTWVGPFAFTTVANLAECPTLVAPADGAVDQNGNVEVSWTASVTGDTATSYKVYIGETSGSLTLAGEITAPSTTAVFNGLGLSKVFYWSVNPVNTGGETTCSTEWSFTTKSPPSGPTGVTCTTGGAAIVITEEMDAQGSWTGDFDSGSAIGKWHFGATTPSSDTGPSSPHSGSKFMYYEAGTSTDVASAVSPAFDLSAVTDDAELSFWLNALGAGIGTLEVGASSNATGPFTNLLTWSGPIGADFIHVGLDLAAYVGGNVYIEFKQTGIGNYRGDIAIDLMEITGCVSCGAASNVVAANVLATSADITWSDGPGCTTAKTVTVTPAITGSPFTVNCGVGSLSLTGLTKDTDYSVAVTNDCGANPTASVAFATQPDFCAGDHFYDTGGDAGNYSDNENKTTTIYPANMGDVVTAKFTSFETESGWDGLMIYDGPDNTAPLLSSGSASGHTTCPDGAWTGTTVPPNFTSTHASGALTFVFTSDGSNTRPGWDVTITCAAPAPCPNPAWTVPSAASGAITSDASCVDGAWTHYYNSVSNEILLSLMLDETAVVHSNAITLDPNGAAPDAFWAASVAGNFVDNGSGAAFMYRKWNVAPIVQPAAEVGVKFYYTNDEYVAVNTEITNNGGAALTSHEQLRFYKVLDGSDPFSVGTLLAANGQELAHGAAAATDTWIHTTEFGEHAAEFKVTGFSGGGGGGATGGSPLPVELSQFTGTTKTRSNMLIWTTESERNSSYFEVQRSVSGSIGYEAIGRVDARGNSSVLVDYSFEDESPSNLTYYRLKMVDMDGSYEYSNVISLVRDGKGFGLLGAYPVPTSAELTVAFNTDESSNMTLVLTDITGRIVLTDKFVSTSGIQKHHVDMTSLVLGTYFVKLSNGQQTLVQRVVKQ